METILGNATNPEKATKRLHWVKITVDHHFIEYKRIDLPSPLFMKWFWFFEYRAALIKTKQPKATVKLEHGSSLAEIQQEEMISHIQRQINRLQPEIERIKCRIKEATANWNGMFPIEEEEAFKKVQIELERKIKRLDDLHSAIERVKKEGWSMKLWNEHYK